MSSKFHKIAGPIIELALKKSRQKFYTGLRAEIVPPSADQFMAQWNVRSVVANVRAALLAAGAHPSVIEDWCNEPLRRVENARLRIERAENLAAVRRAQARRREKNLHGRRAALRKTQRATRQSAPVRAFKAAVRILRGMARGK